MRWEMYFDRTNSRKDGSSAFSKYLLQDFDIAEQFLQQNHGKCLYILKNNISKIIYLLIKKYIYLSINK